MVVFSLSCLVPLSRILLLQHYVSDVLTAAYLALIEVWLLHIVWCNLRAKYKWLN